MLLGALPHLGEPGLPMDFSVHTNRLLPSHCLSWLSSSLSHDWGSTEAQMMIKTIMVIRLEGLPVSDTLPGVISSFCPWDDSIWWACCHSYFITWLWKLLLRERKKRKEKNWLQRLQASVGQSTHLQKWNSIKTFCLEKGDYRLTKLIEHKITKVLQTHL